MSPFSWSLSATMMDPSPESTVISVLVPLAVMPDAMIMMAATTMTAAEMLAMMIFLFCLIRIRIP